MRSIDSLVGSSVKVIYKNHDRDSTLVGLLTEYNKNYTLYYEYGKVDLSLLTVIDIFPLEEGDRNVS